MYKKVSERTLFTDALPRSSWRYASYSSVVSQRLETFSAALNALFDKPLTPEDMFSGEASSIQSRFSDIGTEYVSTTPLSKDRCYKITLSIFSEEHVFKDQQLEEAWQRLRSSLTEYVVQAAKELLGVYDVRQDHVSLVCGDLFKNTVMRVLYYPNDSADVRMEAHEDICLFTLLHREPGDQSLQGFVGSDWVPLESKQGSFSLLNGRSLRMLTGGETPLLTHKVIGVGTFPRLSMAIFVGTGDRIFLSADHLPACLRDRLDYCTHVTFTEMLSKLYS